MIYIILIMILFLAMMGYFSLARRFDILDKPNNRSSHVEVTIRGGGIIYLIAALSLPVLHLEYWMPVLSFLLVGIVSFIDDRVSLSNRTRIFIHLLSVTLLFVHLNLFSVANWFMVAALYILVIGVINAYNFMDGINGITGGYTLIILSSLQYVNLYIKPFVEPDMIWFPILATLVFLYFNFRTKAKCFAGDVGSITIAVWIVYLILSLVLQTGNLSYTLFLAVYGVDTIYTIIHRLLLRQNIFDAHRMHLYQVLANEKKIPQLMVATLFCLVQGVIIFVVLISNSKPITLFVLIIIPLSIIYLIARLVVFRRKQSII